MTLSLVFPSCANAFSDPIREEGRDMKQTAKSRKKRNFLINPEFQLNFMGYTVGMAAVIIAIFYVANIYFFMRFAEKGKEIGLPPEHIFFQFLRDQHRTMDIIFLVTAGFAFIFLSAYGFYLSHRVAGALRRFENHLNEISTTGDVKDLKFRKNDYFQELPVAFNNFLKRTRR